MSKPNCKFCGDRKIIATQVSWRTPCPYCQAYPSERVQDIERKTIKPNCEMCSDDKFTKDAWSGELLACPRCREEELAPPELDAEDVISRKFAEQAVKNTRVVEAVPPPPDPTDALLAKNRRVIAELTQQIEILTNEPDDEPGFGAVSAQIVREVQEPDLSKRVEELERQVEALKVGCKAAQVMLVISTADDRFLQGAAECLKEALEDAQ